MPDGLVRQWPAFCPGFVRRGTEIQHEVAALDDVFLPNPPLMERFAVEFRGLNVAVGAGGIPGFDGEGLAAVMLPGKMQDYFRVEGTAEFVDRIYAAATVGLKQTERRHDEPGAHLALVFVSQVRVGWVMAIIGVKNGSDPLLAHPGLAGPVEQPGR